MSGFNDNLDWELEQARDRAEMLAEFDIKAMPYMDPGELIAMRMEQEVAKVRQEAENKLRAAEKRQAMRLDLEPHQYGKYNKLDNYLKNDFPKLINNKRIVNALKKYGEFTDAQITEIFHRNLGPKIRIADINSAKVIGSNKNTGVEYVRLMVDGKKYNILKKTNRTGSYMGADKDSLKNYIFLDDDRAQLLNRAYGDDYEVVLLLIVSTILHELCHWGDDRDGTDIPGEEGDLFEKAAYGQEIRSWGDAVDILNGYNKRHGIRGKSYSSENIYRNMLDDVKIVPQHLKKTKGDL